MLIFLEVNKNINEILINSRPVSFFSEPFQFKESLANIRLNHRIIRSKIKVSIINGHRYESLGIIIKFGRFLIKLDMHITTNGSRIDMRDIPTTNNNSSYSNIGETQFFFNRNSNNIIKSLVKRCLLESISQTNNYAHCL